MRNLLLFSVLLLGACSPAGTPAQPAASGAAAGAAASAPVTASEGGEETIPCALAGAKTYAQECPVERATVDGKLQLIVKHPDGGFRRFEVVGDGRGVIAADGADEARSVPGEGAIEVFVGEDAYRFPAKAKGAPAAK
jgi:hypothetical protein